MESKEEIELLFNKMMEVSGRIVKISPIYKKDMRDYEKIGVQWRICGIYGYQIFKRDNYTYQLGEKLEDPDISIRINNPELATKFLSGEDMGFHVAPRKDYKGKYKIMYLVGLKDVETEKGPRIRSITKHFLTARIYNEIIKHPFSLLKLPPFQIYHLITKKHEEKEQYGAYIPINQSLGTYENQVIPYAVYKHFIEKASNIVLTNCGCRVFKDCQDHDHSLGCMYIGGDALKLMMPELRERRILTKEEALDKVRRAIDDGLLPVIGRIMDDTENMGVKDEGHVLQSCFCCSCCCVNGKFATFGPSIKLVARKIEGLSVNVDETLCKGSSKCVEICVFRAIEVIDGKAKIDTERCMGCGRCVDLCPNGAITIEIDDTSRIDELIQKIESVVDVRDQASLKH